MKRQDYLSDICHQRFGEGNYSKPSMSDFSSSEIEEINAVYKALGGVLDNPSIRVGFYDIQLEKFIIELDEENHFNRYRFQTLQSSIYKRCVNFRVEEYQMFCKKYENGCRTNGGFWNNPSTDKQFGGSNINGNLSGAGSSRWKQRAFYDFIKDAYSIAKQVPIIRVSIYETYNGKTVNDLINECRNIELLEFINKKYLDAVSTKKI